MYLILYVLFNNKNIKDIKSEYNKAFKLNC